MFKGIGSKISYSCARVFGELFGIDKRALAVFRIFLGLILAVDGIQRLLLIGEFYTDSGLVPRSLAAELISRSAFSLHFSSGAYWFQAALFLLQIGLAASLALGWKTTRIVPLLWLLVLSSHARNELVLHGGDGVLIIMLFFSIFIPISSAWSLDSGFKRLGKLEPRLVSAGTACLILQVLMIYYFTAILKRGDVWTGSFSAVSMAMNVDHWTTSFGRALLEYPALLRFFTAFTYYLELLGPLLLLIPGIQRPVRSVVPLLFIGFHLGIGILMMIGTFPWICIGIWMLFIPSWIWDKAEKFLQPWLAEAGKSEPESDGMSSITIWKAGATGVLAFSFLIMVSSNLASVGIGKEIFAKVSGIGAVFRWNQKWAMFAPHPPVYNSRWSFEGITKSGETVALEKAARGLAYSGALSFGYEKQPVQWKKYMESIWQNGEAQPGAAVKRRARIRMLNGFCRRWNVAARPEQAWLSEIKVREVRRATLAAAPPEWNLERVAFEHRCPTAQ